MADQTSSERQQPTTAEPNAGTNRVGRVGGGRHRHGDESRQREPREARETVGRHGGGRHGQ